MIAASFVVGVTASDAVSATQRLDLCALVVSKGSLTAQLTSR
jgi:hypothetical protein